MKEASLNIRYAFCISIHHNEEALNELADSIKVYGVVEPVILKKSVKGYEIVAGERRFRAAKKSGLSVVPCLLSNYSNEQAAQIALIENTCREAINPIAEAFAIKKLAEEFRYTHEEIAETLNISVGTSKSQLFKARDFIKKILEKSQIYSNEGI